MRESAHQSAIGNLYVWLSTQNESKLLKWITKMVDNGHAFHCLPGSVGFKQRKVFLLLALEWRGQSLVYFELVSTATTWPCWRTGARIKKAVKNRSYVSSLCRLFIFTRTTLSRKMVRSGRSSLEWMKLEMVMPGIKILWHTKNICTTTKEREIVNWKHK